MRITKTFEIEGYDKVFTVNELKIKQIISLMSGDMLDDTSIESMQQKFSEVFLPMCSNIEMAELEDMAPSEVKIIWGKFKEANESFLEVAQKLGLEEILQKLKEAIFEDFSNSVVDLSKLDTQES